MKPTHPFLTALSLLLLTTAAGLTADGVPKPLITGHQSGAVVAGDSYRPPNPGDVLRTLKSKHPRLLLADDTVRNIQQLVRQDPVAARIHEKLLNTATRALGEKPPIHELRDGRRLLAVSQEVRQHVEALSYAFLMTGNQDYVRRTWLELAAAAKFKDWNPAHFLDTAVMTSAFAIGYDWLWDQWTLEQRATLREAIVKLGLRPAMKVYTKGSGWHRVNYNWNQVCNGGIGMGALAVADDEPRLAGEILSNALASLPLAMRAYAPDGAGKEGVTYWNFGSRYNILLLASLQSALGTDFGLSTVDGFKQSGDYQVYMCGAGRMSVDFSDCTLVPLSEPQHFWMGKRYNIPRYSSFRYHALRDGQQGGLLDLLWFDPVLRDASIENLPPDRHFRGAECASMRDSWTNGTGFFAALQGGANRGTHRHFDLGSFILETDGVRWIIDSGKEPATYQKHVNHTPREDFYRVRAEGHNTLVFNPDAGPGQSQDGVAGFKSFDSQSDRATAVLELTRAYEGQASEVTRTFELVRGRTFAVTDQINCPKPADVWSYFHTEAGVELSPDKRLATLTQSGKSLKVKLVAPADAVFEVLAAQPGPESPEPAKQESNKGRRKLAIHLKGVVTSTIKVVFER